MDINGGMITINHHLSYCEWKKSESPVENDGKHPTIFVGASTKPLCRTCGFFFPDEIESGFSPYDFAFNQQMSDVFHQSDIRIPGEALREAPGAIRG